MATLTTVNPKDLEFILNLDKKVRKREEGCFQNYNQTYSHGVRYDYTERLLTKKEVQRLTGIIERSDFVLYPVNTCCGFQVGFEVANVTPKSHKEVLLAFTEKQLPKGYDFKLLSEYFMAKNNLKRAKKAGIEIKNDYAHYDY